MLEQISTFYKADLEKLANIWLASGANCYGLRTPDGRVEQWPSKSNYDILPFRAVTAPIQVNEEVLGELFVTGVSGKWVDACLESNAFYVSRLISQDHDLELITEELVNNQDQLVALYDLLHSTRTLVSVTEIIEGIVQAVGKIFEVSTAFIKLELSDRDPFIATSPNLLDEALVTALAKQALKNRDYLLFSNKIISASPFSAHIKTALVIPLTVQDRPSAVLGLVNKKRNEFKSPDIKLLRAIGEYAESEIENALMHEANIERVKVQTRQQTEMELAHGVQMNLMPQTLPEFLSLDLAAQAIPALSVGGDFYDCLVQSDDQFYFTLGDVSGKGMPAALLMAMTRTTLRNTARLLANSTPQVILDRATDALYDDFTDVGMFSTVFVGAFRPEENKLLFANAGHAPVIYRPVGGSANILEATGPPLGTWPDNLASQSSLPFGPGDVLVAASDGLNEARNAEGEMFDYDRLIDLVDKLAHKSADEILNEVMTAVLAFSVGQPQGDDQTIIVLKRTQG